MEHCHFCLMLFASSFLKHTTMCFEAPSLGVSLLYCLCDLRREVLRNAPAFVAAGLGIYDTAFSYTAQLFLVIVSLPAPFASGLSSLPSPS